MTGNTRSGPTIASFDVEKLSGLGTMSMKHTGKNGPVGLTLAGLQRVCQRGSISTGRLWCCIKLRTISLLCYRHTTRPGPNLRPAVTRTGTNASPCWIPQKTTVAALRELHTHSEAHLETGSCESTPIGSYTTNLPR